MLEPLEELSLTFQSEELSEELAKQFGFRERMLSSKASSSQKLLMVQPVFAGLGESDILH